MEKVKALLSAGATLSEAVQSALGNRSIAQVALERGVNRSNLYSVLGGARVASAKEVDALVAELGGTPEEWRSLFAEAMQRRALAVGC